MRIQHDAHDPQFDCDVPRWRKLYAQHLDSLAVTLDNYTMSILEGVTFDEDRAPYEVKRKILSAAVDSYFPDGI